MDAKGLACFKAYDIRGRVPQDLNLELVRHIGLAYAAEFAPKTVCVGYDIRLSSPDFAKVLIAALQDGGVDVVDLGQCGTEEVYFATFSQGFDGGIMVTASHNPKDWNGLKLVGKGATPIHSGNGLQTLEQRILSGNLPIAERRGASRRESYRQAYIAHLLEYLGPEGAKSLAPLTIVANPGNGCAGPVVAELAKHLPCTVVPILAEPDGTFPHGVPNPLLPENREITRKAVLENKAALGIAWDGDFDRCFFFDEHGAFVEGYYVVGLLAEALLATHPGATILHDPRLTWNTREVVAAAGGTPIETRTGHAFMKDRMRQEDALYGGEMSAHHYFKNFAFCDSGMIVWLLVYQLMSRTGLPLSQLVGKRMARYPVSGEINRKVDNAEAAIQKVRAAFEKDALAVTFVDGVSMEFADWRCNIRMSNTEPLLRLNVETRANPALLEEKTKAILALIE